MARGEHGHYHGLVIYKEAVHIAGRWHSLISRAPMNQCLAGGTRLLAGRGAGMALRQCSETDVRPSIEQRMAGILVRGDLARGLGKEHGGW